MEWITELHTVDADFMDLCYEKVNAVRLDRIVINGYINTSDIVVCGIWLKKWRKGAKVLFENCPAMRQLRRAISAQFSADRLVVHSEQPVLARSYRTADMRKKEPKTTDYICVTVIVSPLGPASAKRDIEPLYLMVHGCVMCGSGGGVVRWSFDQRVTVHDLM